MELVVHVASECADLPEAALCRDRLNFSSWGKGLSLEQYLERERQQWRLPFSRNGLRLWELRNRDETLASLETYAVPVAGGGIAGVGHGIASVFVEERLRGAGHASALVRRVNERLKDEGALLTYLMSEIGAPLYERLGYRGRPLRLRRFAPSDPQQPDLSPEDPRVQPLADGDIAALLKERYTPHRHHRHHRAPLSLFVTPEEGRRNDGGFRCPEAGMAGVARDPRKSSTDLAPSGP
jgi:GNAT superfamily N-acetyltransferase